MLEKKLGALNVITAQNQNSVIKRILPTLQRGADAKKVFRGVFFDTWQWQQELFDGSMATFESLSRPDTVTILALTKEQKVIMTRQSQPGMPGFLSMPGGVIGRGEVIWSAAKRELLEETGYASREWYFLFSGQMNSRIDWANFYLVAKNCELVAEKNLDAGEKIEVELFTETDFISSISQKNFRQIDFALWWLRREI